MKRGLTHPAHRTPVHRSGPVRFGEANEPVRTLRILVADPDRACREALKVRLESAGYDVDTAEDGQDIIMVCQVDPPDVLLTDIHLPDQDGFEVCACVRHELRDRDLTIIVLTEACDDMTRSYLGQMVDYAGGDYFLAKPCDFRVLQGILDDIVSDVAVEPSKPGLTFPTLAVWPTARAFPAASRN